MTLPGVAQAKFVLENLMDFLYQAAHQNRSGYNQMIEFIVRELVQESMRVLAREQNEGFGVGLLDLAMDQVERQVQEKLYPLLDFSLDPYRASLRQSLKYPAREIMELASRLRQVRQQERIGGETSHRSDGGLPFSIVAVGQREAIEALIAVPIVETFELEMIQVRESYRVEGEWFPLYVTIEELGFVVDDDGTISGMFSNGTRNNAKPESLTEQGFQAPILPISQQS